MNVFVAGGTGVLGRRIVPALVARGDRVTVLARHPERVAAGAIAVLGDALDAGSVERALRGARPDAVLHQLTDLATGNFAGNARLRIDGTRYLVDAARALGVRRIVVQSIAWIYEPGDSPADESTPLDLASTDASRRRTVDAVVAMETAAAELPEAVLLRNGLLYGPGTWYAPDGEMATRALPVAGDVASFVHVDDAAAAAVQALAWPPGAVNIVDDDPAADTAWVPVVSTLPPVPGTRSPWARGASNAKAKRLGWSPSRPSWRTGFGT